MEKYSIGPVAAREIYIDAVRRRLWIRAGKEWFTPEQFIAMFKSNSYQEFESIPIVYDPMKAVEEAKITIKAMQDRLDAFVDRINKYYKNG
jgi:hypothetical protein